MNVRLDEGTVTLLFTDIEGSTDLGRQSGDFSARRIFRAHDEIVRTQVAEHGGREIKALGDGFLVAFSSARRAVSCAVAIQRALEEARNAAPDGGVAVRIGLNAGEVIHENDDVFGSAVSAAARITAQAKGNQILASEVVKALVGSLPETPLRDIGEKELKGFDEKWRLFEVQWRRDPPSSAGPKRTPFVGRRREREELVGCLDRLDTGSGELVLISGEPGVGKTRLADEIATEARRRGYRTLTGRSYDMDAPPPYLPFVEILEAAAKEVDRETFRLALGNSAGEIAKIMPQLRNMYEDIPPSLELPPEQERRYLFNSIVEFVERAASTRPLVVVLDDLHWADEPSLSLLQTVAQSLKHLPALLIGTYRDVELDAHRPLSRALDGLVRERLARRINLKRLSHDGVRAMLERLGDAEPPPRLVEIIFAETDGNAFFVEEMFRHLNEEGRLFEPSGEWRSNIEIDEIDVPEGVRLVVGRRLEGLRDEARKALAAAAVVGRTFDYELLESLGEVDEAALLDAIEEAQRLSLIATQSPADTRYEFAHELIRQTLLTGMAAPRRQKLHMRVVQAMENTYADSLEERAPQIVNHLYQAGTVDPKMMVHYLILAGSRAQGTAAFDEALKYYEQAGELCEPNDDELRARVLLGLGQAQRSLVRIDEALDNWREALAIWERLGDVSAVAEVSIEMVLQLGWAGKWEGVLEIATRGLVAVGEEPTPERAVLMTYTAVAFGWAGSYESSMPLLEEAIQIAEHVGDKQILGGCLGGKATILFAYSFLAEATDVGKQSLDLLRGTEQQWNYASSLAFVAITLAFQGRIDEAAPYLEELEEISARLGFSGGIMFANRARYFTYAGRHGHVDLFEEVARKDLEICETYDLPWIGQSQVSWGRVQFIKGQPEDALKSARVGMHNEPTGALNGFGLGNTFIMLSYLDRRNEALELLEEIEARLPAPGTPSTFGQWTLLGYAVEGCFMLGENERAARLYPRVVEALGKISPLRWDGRPFETIAGMAAAAGGRWEEAIDHLEKGVQIARDVGFPVEVVETRRFQATALVMRDGIDERSRDILREVIDAYEGFGMIFHASYTRDLLDRHRQTKGRAASG